MINRKTETHQQVLYSESPQYWPQHGYHFYTETGFKIKVTTLGKTQLRHLAEFLDRDTSSFARPITTYTHGQVRQYIGTGDSDFINTHFSETRPVSAGEVVEIVYSQKVSKLFEASFDYEPLRSTGLSPKKSQQEED
jgi:hypothetical protein